MCAAFSKGLNANATYAQEGEGRMWKWGGGEEGWWKGAEWVEREREGREGGWVGGREEGRERGVGVCV